MGRAAEPMLCTFVLRVDWLVFAKDVMMLRGDGDLTFRAETFTIESVSNLSYAMRKDKGKRLLWVKLV